MRIRTKRKINKVLTYIAVMCLVVMASLAALGAGKVIADVSIKAKAPQIEIETEHIYLAPGLVEVYQAPSLYECRVEESLNAILRNQRTLSNQVQRIEQQLIVIIARQTGADLPETVEK